MKEFKLSKEREERLFADANMILDMRREKLTAKKNRKQFVSNLISNFKMSIDFKVAPLLLPVTAAVVILLLSAPTIEYDGNFIDIGTTILDSEMDQGE